MKKLTDHDADRVRYRSTVSLGFPHYRVGNDGSVWSRHPWRGSVGWRKLVPKGGPYQTVTLCNGGKQRSIMLHHLVLTVFVCPKPEGMEACHGDGNTLNCSLYNLRWDVHINNEADKRRHGTALTGERNPRSVLTENDVNLLHDLWERGRHTRKQLANKFGVCVGTVNMVLRGEIWTELFKNRYPEGRPAELDRRVRPRGEQNGNARLREHQVLSILEKYHGGGCTQTELASQFGVSQGIVSAIVRGASWPDVHRRWKSTYKPR